MVVRLAGVQEEGLVPILVRVLLVA